MADTKELLVDAEPSATCGQPSRNPEHCDLSTEKGATARCPEVVSSVKEAQDQSLLLGKGADSEHLPLDKEIQGSFLLQERKYSPPRLYKEPPATYILLEGDYESVDKKAQGEYPPLDGRCPQVRKEGANAADFTEEKDDVAQNPQLADQEGRRGDKWPTVVDVHGVCLSKAGNLLFQEKHGSGGFVSEDWNEELSLPFLRETNDTLEFQRELQDLRGFEREKREHMKLRRNACVQLMGRGCSEPDTSLGDAFAHHTTFAADIAHFGMTRRKSRPLKEATKHQVLHTQDHKPAEPSVSGTQTEKRLFADQEPHVLESDDGDKHSAETTHQTQAAWDQDLEQQVQNTEEQLFMNQKAQAQLLREISALVERAQHKLVSESTQRNVTDPTEAEVSEIFRNETQENQCPGHQGHRNSITTPPLRDEYQEENSVDESVPEPFVPEEDMSQPLISDVSYHEEATAQFESLDTTVVGKETQNQVTDKEQHSQETVLDNPTIEHPARMQQIQEKIGYAEDSLQASVSEDAAGNITIERCDAPPTRVALEGEFQDLTVEEDSSEGLMWEKDVRKQLSSEKDPDKLSGVNQTQMFVQGPPENSSVPEEKVVNQLPCEATIPEQLTFKDEHLHSVTSDKASQEEAADITTSQESQSLQTETHLQDPTTQVAGRELELDADDKSQAVFETQAKEQPDLDGKATELSSSALASAEAVEESTEAGIDPSKRSESPCRDELITTTVEDDAEVASTLETETKESLAQQETLVQLSNEKEYEGQGCQADTQQKQVEETEADKEVVMENTVQGDVPTYIDVKIQSSSDMLNHCSLLSDAEANPNMEKGYPEREFNSDTEQLTETAEHSAQTPVDFRTKSTELLDTGEQKDIEPSAPQEVADPPCIMTTEQRPASERECAGEPNFTRVDFKIKPVVCVQDHPKQQSFEKGDLGLQLLPPSESERHDQASLERKDSQKLVMLEDTPKENPASEKYDVQEPQLSVDESHKHTTHDDIEGTESNQYGGKYHSLCSADDLQAQLISATNDLKIQLEVVEKQVQSQVPSEKEACEDPTAEKTAAELGLMSSEVPKLDAEQKEAEVKSTGRDVEDVVASMDSSQEQAEESENNLLLPPDTQVPLTLEEEFRQQSDSERDDREEGSSEGDDIKRQLLALAEAQRVKYEESEVPTRLTSHEAVQEQEMVGPEYQKAQNSERPLQENELVDKRTDVDQKTEIVEEPLENEAFESSTEGDLVTSLIEKESSDNFSEREHSESLRENDDAESLTEKEHLESMTVKEHSESLTVKEHTESLTVKEHSESLTVKEHPESLTVKEHPESLTVKEHPESFTVKEHTESLKVKDHAESLTVKEQSESLTVKEHPESFTVKEHPESLTAKEHSESLTVKEYPESLTVQEHPESLTVKEHPDCLTVKENSESLTAKEHPESLTVKEHPECLTVEEHSESLTVKEHSESLTVEEHPDSLTLKEHSESLTAKEHSESLAALTVKEHPEGLTVEEHPEGLTVKEHSESLTVKEHSESSPAKEHSESLPAKEHSESLTVKEHLESFTVKEHPESLTVKEHSESLTVKEHSESLTVKEHSESLREKENSESETAGDVLIQPNLVRESGEAVITENEALDFSASKKEKDEETDFSVEAREQLMSKSELQDQSTSSEEAQLQSRPMEIERPLETPADRALEQASDERILAKSTSDTETRKLEISEKAMLYSEKQLEGQLTLEAEKQKEVTPKDHFHPAQPDEPERERLQPETTSDGGVDAKGVTEQPVVKVKGHDDIKCDKAVVLSDGLDIVGELTPSKSQGEDAEKLRRDTDRPHLDTDMLPVLRPRRLSTTTNTTMSDIVSNIVPYFENKAKRGPARDDPMKKKKQEVLASSSVASSSSGKTYLDRLTEKRSQQSLQHAAVDRLRTEYEQARLVQNRKELERKKRERRRHACTFC